MLDHKVVTNTKFMCYYFNNLQIENSNIYVRNYMKYPIKYYNYMYLHPYYIDTKFELHINNQNMKLNIEILWMNLF